MKNILVLFAHPAFQKSRVNRILIEGIQEIPYLTFHDLYQKYPELDIDVKYEQKLLSKNDIIVFHHPFFWYSVPAILKEWLDLVLEHGWAYGRKGFALKDKWFFNVTTTGGRKEAYCPTGYNKFTIRQLIAPIEQSMSLCNMIYLPPFVVHGTHSITKEKIYEYAGKYHRLLRLLSNNEIDIGKIKSLKYFNDYLE